MDTKSIFDECVKELQTAFPNVTFDVSLNIEEAVSDIEDKFLPNILKIIKHDSDFFSESRMMLGINLSQLWELAETEEQKSAIWKQILSAIIGSFLHGDIKNKFSKILSVAKNLWNGSGQENDEITRILNDDESESRLKEIFDFVMQTRIAKIFMEIVESFNVDDFEIDKPEDIMELLKNQDNPTFKKISRMIQEKFQRGQYSKNDIEREIEAIKAKVASVFGGMFNDMLGGQRGHTSSQVLLSNSPEARRQRMLARLQKKVRDKK